MKYHNHILCNFKNSCRPGQANGGTQKPYAYLIDEFFRKLQNAGLDDADFRMITQTNPVRAFGFKFGE